ncbi:MAG: rod shape-determining protein [Lachnospiraceae bacterium]|nr:rod shape-determining protein [Lachnospiraceae bacterium]
MTDTKYEPADIEIYVKDKGLVLKEKSLIAFTRSDGKILGIGDEAEALAAQNLQNVVVQSPLRQGMIAEYTMANRMFQGMLQKAYGKKYFFKPRIAVGGIPETITEVEKKAVEDLMFQIGARTLTLFECSYEKFKRELALTAPEKFDSFHVIIVIAKNEPEQYVAEGLANVLQYAQKQGISADRVGEMLREIQ